VRILVTGGAGFIGSHTADALLLAGHQVRVLDSLDAQVHGGREKPPAYLSPDVEFVRGDVRDGDVVRRALRGVSVVYHLAAAVGVAQSMYEVRRYVDANCVGTATLLEEILRGRAALDLLVVASSMSIYGEGEYICPACGPASPEVRQEERLARGEWEHACPTCGAVLTPRPTRESKRLRPRSPYAVTKRDQEELCLSVGEAYKLPTTALRYFNVYGPRQALSNPYTGLSAIFSSRIMHGRSPIIFEDGSQSRDFVHVSDVARANVLALSAPQAVYQSINIGTGRPATVGEVADALIRLLDSKVVPAVPGKYRAGDIRHCYADVTAARDLLGFEATVSLEKGLADLLPWLVGQHPDDLLDEAIRELESRGLAG